MRLIKVYFAVFSMFCCISAANAQVEVHGFSQNRFLIEPGNYSFRVDRAGLRLQERINPQFSWLIETYIHPAVLATSPVYLESAYLNWDLSQYMPWDFVVRFGKSRNEAYGIAPYYANRKTSDYSLYSDAITRARVHGIQTFSNLGILNLAVAVLNGYTVDTGRLVPDMPIDAGNATQISIGYNETPVSTDRRLAFSSRLGIDFLTSSAGISYYISETTDGVDTGAQRLIGLDGSLRIAEGLFGGAMLQGQYTWARSAFDNQPAQRFDHSGAEILTGWESALVSLYGGYSILMYDDDFFDDNSQWIVSLLVRPHSRVHLRLEALWNREENTEVDNDRYFFELLFVF